MAILTKSYSSQAEATSVVEALKDAGFDNDSISFIAGADDEGGDLHDEVLSEDERIHRGLDRDRYTRDQPMGDPLVADPMVGSTLGGTIAGRSISGVAADPEYARGDDPIDNGTAAANSSATDDAAVGAASGGILGGGAGLLAGLGLMTIPGIGPVVAAGWLASTAAGALVGAAAGGATGGIIGALSEAGVPSDASEVYAENVKRGGAIVSIRVAEEDKGRADAIMSEHGPIDPQSTGADYRRTGWNGFDAAGGALPFNPNPPAI